jgi:hypothetical protein
MVWPVEDVPAALDAPTELVEVAGVVLESEPEDKLIVFAGGGGATLVDGGGGAVGEDP